MGKKIKYETLYEDKDVLINEHEIQIKYYIFPTCQSKVIPFTNIKHVEIGELSMMTGQGRLWGMSLGKWGYWFAGDASRFSRNQYIAIHTSSSIKKAFTTEHTKRVYDLLVKLWSKAKQESLTDGEVEEMKLKQ